MTGSPICDLVRLEHIFVYAVWDRSKSRSSIFCIYIYLCFVGHGPSVF